MMRCNVILYLHIDLGLRLFEENTLLQGSF